MTKEALKLIIVALYRAENSGVFLFCGIGVEAANPLRELFSHPLFFGGAFSEVFFLCIKTKQFIK